MDFKLLFILFAVLTEQAVVGDEPFPQNILQNFQDLVNQTVEGAIEDFENVLNSVVVVAQRIEKEAGDRVKQAFKTLPSLVEESENLGVQVTDCIQSSEIEEGFIKSLADCVESNVRKGKNFVTQAIVNVKAFFEILDEVQKELSECQILDVGCFSDVAVDVGVKTASLSFNVSAEIVEVSTYLGSIQSKVMDCGENVGLAAVHEAQNITQCIEKERSKRTRSKRVFSKPL